MPSTRIAREPVSALLWHTMQTADAAAPKGGLQNTIYPRGLLQPRRGQANPNGITRTENIILVITIVLFLAFMFSFVWYLMFTGKEMNELGGIGAARGKATPKSAATAPADLPEQNSVTEKTVEVDSSSGSSAKESVSESVSESDRYWLWWTRRANKMEDEEASTGPQSRSSSQSRISNHGSVP